VGRILVTGGAGFIGSAFAHYAHAQGYQVIILDNLKSGKASNFDDLQRRGIECVQGDIRDKETVATVLNGCEYVVHLAAQVSVNESISNPDETLSINVDGTQTLVEQCVKHPIKRFILASSAAVYGNNQNLPLKEVDIGEALSPYAESKIQNEQQIEVLNSSETRAIALRFFNVYGSGQEINSNYSAVIPTFVKQINEATRPTIFGNGRQTRDFVHVDDVCKAILSFLEIEVSSIQSSVFNVATQHGTSLLTLIDTINTILIEKMEIRAISPLFSDTRQGDIPHSIGSTERLYAALGWKPTIQLKDGIKRMIYRGCD
jgi:nucleoside-diphosphate-sugar epimerase